MLLQKNISHELNYISKYLDLDFNCCYTHTYNCY